MNRATFTDWLRSQTYRDDPVGDLARDLTADPVGPADDHPVTVLDYVAAVGGPAAGTACLAAVAEYMAGESS